MKTISGIFKDGRIELDEAVEFDSPKRVNVIFLEEENLQKTDLSMFSFRKSQEVLKKLSSSLSEEVINERRKK